MKRFFFFFFGMAFDNIEPTLEFDPCINYAVSPRLLVYTRCDPAAILNIDP